MASSTRKQNFCEVNNTYVYERTKIAVDKVIEHSKQAKCSLKNLYFFWNKKNLTMSKNIRS